MSLSFKTTRFYRGKQVPHVLCPTNHSALLSRHFVLSNQSQSTAVTAFWVANHSTPLIQAFCYVQPIADRLRFQPVGLFKASLHCTVHMYRWMYTHMRGRKTLNTSSSLLANGHPISLEKVRAWDTLRKICLKSDLFHNIQCPPLSPLNFNKQFSFVLLEVIFPTVNYHRVVIFVNSVLLTITPPTPSLFHVGLLHSSHCAQCTVRNVLYALYCTGNLTG